MSNADTDRLLDLPFLCHSVVAELSNRRGGDYGYEYGRKPSINNDFNGLTCVSWTYTVVTHELLQYMP